MQKETIAFALPSPIPGSGGWGNGYVALPEGHPFFGVREDYDAPVSLPLDANGGLTFSQLIKKEKDSPYNEYAGMWVLGFDTLHSWDTPEQWPDEASVMEAVLELKAQCDDKGVQLKYLQDNLTHYQQIADSYKKSIETLMAE